MKQQEVFKKIGGIIKELHDQYEYLVTISEDLNDLELELFVANAHFLADHAEILRKLNLQKAAVSLTAKRREKVEELIEPPVFKPKIVPYQPPYYPEQKKPGEAPLPETLSPAPSSIKPEDSPVPVIDLQDHQEGDEFFYVRQEPEVTKNTFELNESLSFNGSGETVSQPVVTQPMTPLSSGLSEPFAKPVTPPIQTEEKKLAVPSPVQKAAEQKNEDAKPLTINQRMSAMRSEQSKTTEPALAQPPLTDLKSAITLNDKLLFIRELFNGYNLAYSEAIDLLNRFTNFEEAERFLKANYASKNNWESKQPAADKFYALIRRRYGN
jgi:hypothetical protein